MNDTRMHTSGETYFFRDHGQFDLLRLRLLPELIERNGRSKVLRLWSAGCASGEEAYSLAILVDMLLPKRDEWNILIVGSDIDTTSLAKARHGCYGQWSFRMVPAVLQQRYFHCQNGQWTLDERIRRMVSFRAFDLIDEPYPRDELQNMDLILCRNVLIYFDADTVTEVAKKLLASLSETGYLMTAHAELVGRQLRDMRSRLFAESVVYQRAPVFQNEFQRCVSQIPAPSPATQVVTANDIPERAARHSLAFSVTAANAPVISMPASAPNVKLLLGMARAFADQGEYDQAESSCRQLLAEAPLTAEAHFLLAQLAQLRGDFELARTQLDKTLYLDPRCVAATLELAALCERAENLPRARVLRRTALNIVQSLPGDAAIEPYDSTAADMAQWLAQSTPS